jgi:hypothetical protein
VHDPVYILGTRDYQHGRPAKHIHWKATARHHKLQEKVFEPTAQEKVLLVLDVRQYAGQKAEDEFESTLEIIASMAVLLDRRNCAVGLATNCLVRGGRSSVVPVARNAGQLTTLLETLARLQMEPGADLVDTMRDRLTLPWGLSCLSFTLEQGSEGQALEGYFRDRRVPCTFFVNRPGSGRAGNGYSGGSLMRGLDEVRIAEGRG